MLSAFYGRNIAKLISTEWHEKCHENAQNAKKNACTTAAYFATAVNKNYDRKIREY